MSQLNEVDDHHPQTILARDFLWKSFQRWKERKGRPVENDAPDGNPTKQDFHSGLQNLRVSHISHRPDGELINDTFQGPGFHLKEAGFLSEEWGAPPAMNAMGGALHAVQDYTSPEHTSVSGEFLQWNGYSSPGAVAHYLGENSPSDGWFRIGQAIRLTMAAFLQANLEGARSAGLTEQNFDREANKRISDFVDRFFRSSVLNSRLPGLRGGEDAARQCALGNPAACDF